MAESCKKFGGVDNKIDKNVVRAAADSRIRINKWRVREGFAIKTSQVILLYEILDGEGSNDVSLHKLKADVVNTPSIVKKCFYKEGDVVQKGAVVLEFSECSHMTVLKDLCAECGSDLRRNRNGKIEANVPMVHSMPELKVTQKLAQKIGHDDTRRLLESKKLVLLVDLDQTVIHTTNDLVPNNIKNIYHFQLYGQHSPWYHTRLRPGTAQFLENMTNLYELHICTFGARNYAHMIAQLLDPDGRFFSNRILSRDECFNATCKTDNLKALFPNGDSMVCIIDDREDVWNMASNLIQVKPYHFFQHTGDINAPPGLQKHELDGKGVDFKEMDKIKGDTKDSSNSSGKAMTSKDAVKEEEVSQARVEDLKNITQYEELDIMSVAEDKLPTEAQKSNQPNTSENKTDSNDSKEKGEIDFNTEKTVQNIAYFNEIKKSNEDKNDISEGNKSNVQIENTLEPSSNVESLNEDKESEEIIVTNEENTDSEIDKTERKIKTPDPNNLIEIEDPDDYLLYLEVILKTIHTRFYNIYNETQEIPDLKIIVPKIRAEVLRGQNLVFSGLVPTHMKLEQSRAYFIAKSLGANVSTNITAESTHLVAVTAGTVKVNTAKKNPKLKVVNANWLWACAERWEHVEERLFPLGKTKSKQRQPPAHCHSPEHVVNYSEKSEISESSSAQMHNSERFSDTINPLLVFSNAELADMNNEVEQYFESDSSSGEEQFNSENPPVNKTLRKRKREEKDEQRTRDFFTRSESMLVVDGDLDISSGDDSDEADDDDIPSAKFRRGENLPSDLDMDNSDSVGTDNNNPDSEDDGEWNMMGAALERGFLGIGDEE